MVKCAGQSHCISLLLILSTQFSIHHLIMIEQYVYQGAEAAIVLHVHHLNQKV